jgi:hypothetical protein
MNDQGFVKRPFSALFLVFCVAGFLISLYYTIINYNWLDPTWGLLAMLMFAIFGVAALKSMKCCKKHEELPKKSVKKKAAKKAKKKR